MSVGKFLGGTVIATPAVGGGGYVIYKEVTKETTNSPTESTEGSESDSTSPKGEVTEVLGPKGNEETQSGGALSGVASKAPGVEGNGAVQEGVAPGATSVSSTVGDVGTTRLGETPPSAPLVGAMAGRGENSEVTGSDPGTGLGSSGGGGSPGSQ